MPWKHQDLKFPFFTYDFDIYSKENCLFKFFSFMFINNTGMVFVLFNCIYKQQNIQIHHSTGKEIIESLSNVMIIFYSGIILKQGYLIQGSDTNSKVKFPEFSRFFSGFKAKFPEI